MQHVGVNFGGISDRIVHRRNVLKGSSDVFLLILVFISGLIKIF